MSEGRGIRRPAKYRTPEKRSGLPPGGRASVRAACGKGLGRSVALPNSDPHLRGAVLSPLSHKLEFEAKVRKLKDDLAGKIGDVKKRVIETSRKDLWNEIGDFPDFLELAISQWMQSKIIDAENHRQEVERLLESSEAIKLPFDHDVMYRSRRRMLAGRVKTTKARGDADCFIIESLVRFFDGKEEDCQLLLCTENLTDFGVETKDGKKALHPLMKDGLPPTELFTDLASLVNFIKEHGKVVEPGPEEVKEAVEREEAEKREEAIQEALLQVALPDEPIPKGIYAIMRDMGWTPSMPRTIGPDTLRMVSEMAKAAGCPSRSAPPR
jgi:hypothetical protein